MCADATCLSSLIDIRDFVQRTICDQHELEMNAYQLSERVLVRKGKPCGILFCLHGPRSVRLTAVWETDRNTILFYGASGERLLKTKLVESPELHLSTA